QSQSLDSTVCDLCHRDGRHLYQADGLGVEVTTKLLGERAALIIRPAERRGTSVLQINDGGCGHAESGGIRGHHGGAEAPRVPDDPRNRWPAEPGASVVASRHPYLSEGCLERLVVEVLKRQNGEPAAGTE